MLGGGGARWTRACRTLGWLGGGAFLVSLAHGAYVFAKKMGEAPRPGTRTLPEVARNTALFAAFALHHSIAARPAVKRAVERLVGPCLERASFVWTASVLFSLTASGWHPVPGQIYARRGRAATAHRLTQLAGVGLTAWSALALDPLELAGIERQHKGPSGRPRWTIVTRGPYSFVRHPIYTGWILMVFGSPRMTGTRLVFASTSTLYLLLAMPLEERSLVARLGDGYRDYSNAVRFRLVPFVY